MTGAARTSPERQLRRFPRAYRLRDIAADRVEERLRLLAPGRGRHGAHGCGPRGGTRRLDELRHRRVFRLTVGGFGNFSAPPKASAVAPTRTHRSTVSGRRGRRGRRGGTLEDVVQVLREARGPGGSARQGDVRGSRVPPRASAQATGTPPAGTQLEARVGRERQAAAVRGAQAERDQAAAARAEDPARGGRANGGTRQPDRAGTHAGR